MNRRTSLAALAGLGGSLSLMTRQAQAATNSATSDITGLNKQSGTSFIGTFTVNKFIAQNGKLAAAGTLIGTLIDDAGNILGAVSQAVTLPVSLINGTCQILHLELGPLDLNLLGLQVHLDQVVLDITAQQGPGNLLGNLLCAVAGLLDGGGPLSGIANLRNNILRILG